MLHANFVKKISVRLAVTMIDTRIGPFCFQISTGFSLHCFVLEFVLVSL